MERKEECASCKYGEFFNVNEQGEINVHELGVCRRYPPQPSAHYGYSEFKFPNILTKDWCGEWKGKEA
jgi:hypothetical protein